MTSPRQKSVETTSLQSNNDSKASKAEEERRWRLENADAIRAENEDVEKHGLPLARHRLF